MSERSSRIVSARFYANGKRITTDNSYPFQVRSGAKFDTRDLTTADPVLRLTVTFKARRLNGTFSVRTLKRNIRIESFLKPDQTVTGKSTTPTTPPPVTPPVDPPPVPTAFGYPLAFSDEFDGTAMSTRRWSRQRYDRLGTFTTDPGPQPYNEVEGAAYAIANVSVSDGALNLKTSNAPAPGALPKYTRSTGMVNTHKKFSFKYGYLETRALVPSCSGCWPTLWILPENDSWPPEVDVFEYIKSDVNPFPYSTPHWGTSKANHEYLNSTPAGMDGDFTGDWHTYGMLWTPTSLQFYFDGVPDPEKTFTDPKMIPQTAMYAIFQMATGDNTYNTPPNQVMKVDYVHIFSSAK